MGDSGTKNRILERRQHRIQACRQALATWNLSVLRAIAENTIAAHVELDSSIPEMLADNVDRLPMIAKSPGLVLTIPSEAWREAIAEADGEVEQPTAPHSPWTDILQRLVLIIGQITSRDPVFAAGLTGLSRGELERLELADPLQATQALATASIRLRYSKPEKWQQLLLHAGFAIGGQELAHRLIPSLQFAHR